MSEWVAVDYASSIEKMVDQAGADAARRAELAHTIIGLLSLALLSIGAWRAWGVGYACLLLGGLLLAGVIYARTRHEPRDGTTEGRQ